MLVLEINFRLYQLSLLQNGCYIAKLLVTGENSFPIFEVDFFPEADPEARM